MFKSKLLTSILLAALVVASQFGAAYAQTATPAAPITGTVQSTTVQTDSTGNTIVVVTVLDALGATQTVNLSVDHAVSLGLVTIDPTTNLPVVNSAEIGQSISIDPSQIIPTPTSEPSQNPVASVLASFFGVDVATINGYVVDGFGYGEIAQALWMSKIMNGDATLAGAILTAKKTGDYSAFTPAGGTAPTNWGQFRKLVLSGKGRNNLGAVMSGQSGAVPSGTPSPNGPQNGAGMNGSGIGHGHGNGNGHGKP